MVASVGRITAGSGYDYLTREVATSRHDYYTGSGEAPGVWAGSGLSELGLAGVVDAEVMAALYGRFVDPRTAGGIREVSGRMLPEIVLGQKVSVKVRADGTIAEPVAAFDVTFSPSKSVSVLWATASDPVVRDTVLAVHEDAVVAALAYLEGHAGHTRAGRNGVRRVATSGFIIAQFRHRTARAVTGRVGDPQLHSHCAILNRVRGVDGRWRTLDGTAIYRQAHAAGAIYAATVERDLTARLAVSWQEPAVRVPMREIAGIPDEVSRRFSSRRTQLLERYEQLLEVWTETNGRTPTRAEKARLLDDATLRSRRAKQHGHNIDLHDRWRHQLTSSDQSAVDTVAGQTTTHDGGRLPAGSRQLTAAVIEALQEQRAWWTRAHVTAEVARLTDTPTADAIERDSEQIVAGCINLEPDDDPDYALTDDTKFTSAAIQAAEQRILAAATVPAAWAIPTVDKVADRGEDQVLAVRAVTDGSYQSTTVIGPAGSGKTTILRDIAAAYTKAGRPVVVLSLSAAAARVVTDETGLAAATIASWRVGQTRIARDGLVVVDEASMVPTLVLDQLVRVAAAYNCRVALVGDYAQMGAPEAGGLLRDLHELPNAVHLHGVHRFTNEWERAASRLLRRRDTTVTDTYETHGRIVATTTEEAFHDTATAWLADLVAGRDSLIVVDTNSDAADVATICQRLLDRHGHLGAPVGTDRDGHQVRVGDLIQTRHNTGDLHTSDGSRVLNRDVWRVIGRRGDGAVVAEHVRRAARVAIDVGYLAEHVHLAYATTVAGAQGRTVDTGHVIVTPHTTAGALYVGMTRGRLANHAHVVTDSHDHEEFRLGDRTATGAFGDAVTRVPDGQLSATTIARRWHEQTAGRTTARREDQTRQATVDWWEQRTRSLPPRVQQALAGHHHKVLADLERRAPTEWASVVTAALSVTDWRARDAGPAFVAQLARTPSLAADHATGPVYAHGRER